MPQIQEIRLVPELGPIMEIGFCAVGDEANEEKIHWVSGLIDTGANRTCIPKELASKWGLPCVAATTAANSNNERANIEVYEGSILVRGIHPTPVVIRGVLIPETRLKREQFDVLVGRNLLSLGSLWIDYAAKIVRVSIEQPRF